MPKNAASKPLTSASTGRAGTYDGSLISSGSTPAAASSSAEKKLTDSTPSRRFCQKAAVLSAPGKRPAMPTTAIRRSMPWSAAGPASRSGAAGRSTTRAAATGAAAAAPFASRISASVCTAGASNSVTDGSVTPNRFFTRVSICSATSELPPRSKKLSLVPTGCTPSTADQTSASARSVAVSGGAYGSGRSGRGKASAGAVASSSSAAGPPSAAETRGTRSSSPAATTSGAGSGLASSRPSASSPSWLVIACLAIVAPMPPSIRSSVPAQVSQLAAIQRVRRPWFAWLSPIAVSAALAAA